MTEILPPMIQCPYCDLPIPVDSTDRPYCDRRCFDAHVNMALVNDMRGTARIAHVIEKIHRVSNHVGKYSVPRQHCTNCTCHEC